MSASFKPRCPSCELDNGIANTVGFTGNQRTVTYSCPQCQHTWTATDWVPRLLMQPEVPPTFLQK